MTVQPYLFFPGTCEEAFDFYARALGGKIVEKHHYSEMPEPDGAQAENHGGPSADAMRVARDRNYVMHASLSVDGHLIMGADAVREAHEPPLRFEGFKITLGFDDVEDARKAFDALSPGGTIEMPFGPTFWSTGFGMFTDRFDIPWMINGPDPKPEA
jgi:PhnB protein